MIFYVFMVFLIPLGNPGSLLVPFLLSDSSQKSKVIEVTGPAASMLALHSLFLLAKLHLHEPLSVFIPKMEVMVALPSYKLLK